MTYVEVIHPGGGLIERAAPPSVLNRLQELDAQQLALFSNNKPNVDIFYDELSRLLLASKAVAGISRVKKLSSAFPAGPQEIEAATAAQLVINAVGD